MGGPIDVYGQQQPAMIPPYTAGSIESTTIRAIGPEYQKFWFWPAATGNRQQATGASVR